MRLLKVIGLAAAGLALSTILAACAHQAAEAPPPEPVVVVRTVIEKPPAELLRCPTPPAGLPGGGEAVLTAEWRAGIIRLARGYAEVSDQLRRLIQFHNDVSC